MKIVQLSDVHFGAQFRDDIFNQVIDEVNELSPDAVIISGDLTNEGLKEEYEGCKELVSKINVIIVLHSTILSNSDNSNYLAGFKNVLKKCLKNEKRTLKKKMLKHV